MILQSLTKLYEDLSARGDITPPGWGPTKIGFALCIDENGDFVQLIPQSEESKKGATGKPIPKAFVLPAPAKRSSDITSNFLWDNATYVLGMDFKGKPDRALQCFKACRTLHHALLKDVNTPIANAILLFFNKWDPATALDHPGIAAYADELAKGSNLIFCVNGTFAQDDAKIQSVWQAYYDKSDGKKMQCLVTGKEDVIEPTHPMIKGVRGANASGALLVSNNAASCCSYGKEQSYNAPVSKYAAFAYTSALNYLLAEVQNVQHIGDTTIVGWSDGAEPQYREFAAAALFGGPIPDGLDANDLYSAVQTLAEGSPCAELQLDPNCTFYVLGLAPNVGRISVRFFAHDTFGNFMRNVNAHYKRMEIDKPRDGVYRTMPLWAMLQETVNMKSHDKSPNSVMAGATARAIWSGGLYPASLLEETMLRIRCEQTVTRGRAAIIKAYYLNNETAQVPKEVLQVSLNEYSTNIPYVLGRLFATYEHLQITASPKLKVTIRDKYFNLASAAPATFFPILTRFAQQYMRQLVTNNNPLRKYHERIISQIKDILPETLPTRLTLPEQGSFDLGYYHQIQKFYTEKEEKRNGSN